jgi:hypothetical protein
MARRSRSSLESTRFLRIQSIPSYISLILIALCSNRLESIARVDALQRTAKPHLMTRWGRRKESASSGQPNGESTTLFRPNIYTKIRILIIFIYFSQFFSCIFSASWDSMTAINDCAIGGHMIRIPNSSERQQLSHDGWPFRTAVAIVLSERRAKCIVPPGHDWPLLRGFKTLFEQPCQGQTINTNLY